jgi:hypothetical protein
LRRTRGCELLEAAINWTGNFSAGTDRHQEARYSIRDGPELDVDGLSPHTASRVSERSNCACC